MDRDATMRSHKSHVSTIIVTHREELRHTLLREKLLAEFVGTFFLVLTVGTAAVGGSVMPAVAIGLVLAVQIYTFGAVSGGFFNPAVTLAVHLSRREKISAAHTVQYIAVQCLAGVIGAFCALAATDRSFYFDHALTKGWGSSFLLEALFTMALCSTVLAAGTSNDAPNHYFGFAIGLTVTGGALASGGFDQGSFNPAVTFGINLANYANSRASSSPSAGAWALFLLAPLLGGILAAAVFRGTRSNEYLDGEEATVPASAVGQKAAAAQEDAPCAQKAAPEP